MQKRLSFIPLGFCLIGPSFAAKSIPPEYCPGRVAYQVVGERLGQTECIMNNKAESGAQVVVVENLAEVPTVEIEEPKIAFIKPVFGLRVGSNWTDWGDNQSVDVNPPAPSDKFTADKQTQSNVGLGVFVGGEFSSNQTPWHLQAGLSYDWLSSVDLKGTLFESGVQSFEKTYQYNIEHQRINAEFKALRRIAEWYPYFTVALGAAWNKSTNYAEEEINLSGPRPFVFMDSTTVTSFTWSVGAGLERGFGENWRLGLGYLYTDAGKAKLDTEETSDSLAVNSLSINQLLLQITYIM